MTILEPPPAAPDELASGPDSDLRELQLGNIGASDAPPGAQVETEPEPEEEPDGRPPVNPFSASAAAFLSTAAVGWMLGGIFVGFLPRLIGVAGALIGAGLVGVSFRLRNPSTLQFLALPMSIIVGIALVAPSAGGSSVPSLVIEAIKAGGLSQPPAPFDPGWRLLLLVLTCSIAVAAATGAVAFNKSRLAVFLPAPVVGAGVLIQPKGQELLSVAPSLALVVGGLALAFGGELSRDSETGAKFESRRLGKAGGLLLVIVAAMVGLSQLGFLYPPTPDSTVIPPKRPQTPPAVTNDDVLFTVKAKVLTPLRLGVLDVYDGVAWLTPPYDPKRYVDVVNGPLPAFAPDRSKGYDSPQTPPTKTVTTEVSIAKPGPAREIPDVSNPVSVQGAPKGTQYDPRSQTLRLPGRADQGQSYTVTAAAPPDAAVLSQAKTPPAQFKQFVQVPAAPPAVQELLDATPKTAGAYERLQFVRTQFYKKITAAGAGNPVDVPPTRVQAFLTGTPASPYEITASEVLLARWAGIPARIGYGYYNPDAKPAGNGRIDIRPSDGAMWLEAYFSNTGWTPILGKPPKAQSSLDNQKKKKQQILPNGLITAQLYIPIRQQGLSLLYSIVQFWLARIAVVGGIVFFFWILLPGLIKMFRRVRRRRWADELGPREQLAVAYAELRDRAIDFNIGHPTLTPLEFLDVLEPDEEHTQLAWLITRGLWGDLRRDLRREDVEAAETMARSMFRRLIQGQPFLTRVVAFGSRVSLRDPWDPALPNPYWKRSIPDVLLGWVVSGARALRPRRLVPLLGRSTAVVIACAFLLTGCVQQLDLSNSPKGVAPLPSIPAKVGDYTIERSPVGDAEFKRYRDIALIQDYGFYAVRQDNVAVATLQTANFKAGLRAKNHKVREGVLTTLGGSPQVTKVAGQVFYTVMVNDLRLVVWFPKDGRTYQLLAATKDLANPTDLFARLIAVEQGKSATEVATQQGAAPSDGRRSAP
jgi:transglutaminase-like putative cysteine protease